VRLVGNFVCGRNLGEWDPLEPRRLRGDRSVNVSLLRMPVGVLWMILHRSEGVGGVDSRDLDREVVDQCVGFLPFVRRVVSRLCCSRRIDCTLVSVRWSLRSVIVSRRTKSLMVS